MEDKITNCHTHIFTGDHVPPRLGKTLMPFPFYYLVNIKWLIGLVRSANDGWLKNIRWFFKTPLDRFSFWWRHHTEHTFFSKFIAGLLRFTTILACVLITLSFLRRYFTNVYIIKALNYAVSNPYVQLLINLPWWWKAIILLLGIVLIRSVRTIIKLLLFAAFSFLKIVMGSANIQLLKRYYNIALLSKDRSQRYIFSVLRKSYPAQSNFIVLPMDMDYIKAGKPRFDYLKQLDELAALKQHPEHGAVLRPFVFADPRRIEEQPGYYATMIDCLENRGFSGIKIYPALGYYPFDKHLLELFLYAAQKGIPVLTHCIRGVIFYRGIKKKEWDHHPVFTETRNGGVHPMKLKQFKNIDFTVNFTHPLNYLCLLDPSFLKIVLFNLAEGEMLTNKLYDLYGFTKKENADASLLLKDLRLLNLCFGHFGGEDEWEKYIDADRNNYDNKFVQSPLHFQTFQNPALAAAWKQETWYSIIRSIIMNPEYPNVYADISFILYDEKIISLLKASLQVPHLKDRILYGTDFYVVRQKGTDKKFWTDILARLTEEEINQIAKLNPAGFVQ